MTFSEVMTGRWGWLLAGGALFLVGSLLALLILEGIMGGGQPVPDPPFCCSEPMDGGVASACAAGETTSGGLGKFNDQCELPDFSRAVVQTWNTWSNLPFILFGLLVGFRNAWTFGSDQKGVSVAGVFVGICFVLIGTMSMAFHGTMTPDTQDLDIWAIYFGLLALLAAALVSTWEALRSRWWASALLCLIAFIGFVSYLRRDVELFESGIFVPILAGLVIVGLGLRYGFACANDSPDGAWHLRFWIPVLLGLGFLGLGTWFKFSAGYDACPRDLFLAANGGGECSAVFEALRPKEGCSSCSGWGPHAWWHVFAALGLFLAHETHAPRSHRVIGL